MPEALQQAAKDGRLCLREGPLVATEADGAATAAVDDSAMGGGMADAPAPTPQPPPMGAGPRSVQEDVAEVAVAEADGDGAAGGISTDAPAPASQSSSPVVVDPPVAGAAAARSVKEHVSQADRRAGYRKVTAAEQAAKQADVQSQRRGAQVVARLRQARCGRGDEEEGVDPAEEPATHAASQSSGVALAEHAGASAMEQDSLVSVCSSHVPNALVMRARDSMESQCDPATEVQPGGAHTAAPPEAGGQPMADEADEEDDGEEYEFN